MTKGAVGYQIRKLEEHLQCALFNRSVRQVYLTDAGQALFKTTQLVFRDLGNTLTRLNADERNHAITIAATTYVAVRWLSLPIAGFSEQHPDLPIIFQHTVNSADFKLQDVDIAVRWCRCDGRADANRILELPMPLYVACSPRLLKRLGISQQRSLTYHALAKAPLNEIPLLCEDRAPDLWQEWIAPSGLNLTNPCRIISDANVRVQAAIDGQGLILADLLMQPELDNGLLVSLFTEQLEGYGYALLRSPGRVESRRAKALKEWLVDVGW